MYATQKIIPVPDGEDIFKDTEEDVKRKTSKCIRAHLAKIGLVFQDQQDKTNKHWRKVIKIHPDNMVNVRLASYIIFILIWKPKHFEL